MRRRIAFSGVLLLLGLALGYAIAVFGPFSADRGAPMAEADTTERKILYWVAPMDPNFRSDRPGKSPMGMDLIPVYEGEDPGDETGSIRIDPSVVNNIGVQTARAEAAALNPPISTVGRILYDEERVIHIHLRSEGWIERLAVRAVGEPVEKGDLLFDVYSPDLVNAQAEFLQVLRGGRANLIEAARERLRALDISEGQIDELETTRAVRQYVNFYAPISGAVTELNVADGQFVKPETEIMALADLSVVWLISDVFESQVDRIRVGATVRARSKFEPGEELVGTVDYIYPDLEPVTRTVPVRTVLSNSDNRLKPGMFMTVRIAGAQRPEATIIPRQALIRTGRQERVIVALGDGRFEPRLVESGIEADGMIEILQGLEPGTVVVTSGQFLIDSESSFSGASLLLMDAETRRDDAPRSATEGQVAEPAGGDRIEGLGQIEAIDSAERTLIVAHEPIPELGWSAMSMAFAVDPALSLDAFRSQQNVRFILVERQGRYVITDMEPLP